MSQHTRDPFDRNEHDRGPEDEEGKPEGGAATTLFTPRVKMALALGLFVAALGYFVFTTFSGATVYYQSVSEVRASGPTPEDRLVRVSGKLVDDSFSRDASGLTAHFQIKDDDGDVMPVRYPKGEVGEVFFNPHSVLDLEGRYTEDGVFNTEQLIIKCPSKYLTEQERAELEGEDPDTPYEVITTSSDT
ncbi:MAG: cytochrome c maturation protein CcmE [Chloroflexota bacterium]